MICNMGEKDKLLRLLLAAIIILIGVLSGVYWLPLLALIPILTIFFSFCPLYYPFKISTVENKEKTIQKSNFDKEKTITIKQEDLAPKKETSFALNTQQTASAETITTSEPKIIKKKAAKKVVKKKSKKNK